MDSKWILKCLLLFLPIILLAAYFNAVSYEKMGIPFASFDMQTHYSHLPTDYAPLIQTMNAAVYPLGKNVYDMYFISLVYASCFVIPFILLHKLTNSLEYPVFFLYGTAIGANHFIVGLLPQAILIDMILFMGIYRKSEYAQYFLSLIFLLPAFLLHSFGVFFILGGYLFWWVYDSKSINVFAR